MSGHGRVWRFLEKCDNHAKRKSVFFTCTAIGIVASGLLTIHSFVDMFFADEGLRRSLLKTVGNLSSVALVVLFACFIVGVFRGIDDTYIGPRTRATMMSILTTTVALASFYGVTLLL